MSENCTKRCGHREVTGILLDDPHWLEKEEQLAKCDGCRSKRKAREDAERRRSRLMTILAESRRRKTS